MGQQEVLDILKANKGVKMTAHDIASLDKALYSSISVSLRKLRDSRMVKYKYIQIATGNSIRKCYIYWL